MSTTAKGWMMTEPGKALEPRSFELAAAWPGEAIVEVAGCGLRHTTPCCVRQRASRLAIPAESVCQVATGGT
ncbi:MAG: hypothetical protein MUF54_22245 [Polyangiaceae bacterium]|jgi:hypothetical protein|nr:hypothetical protein [Polyangiaceae bacterium]